MKLGVATLALTAAVFSTLPLHASTAAVVERQLTRVVVDVEHAFARRSATFKNASLERLPVPALASDLFPAYGFAPPSTQVAWQLQPLNDDQVRVCLTVRLDSVADWKGYVRALSNTKLKAASAQCEELPGASGAAHIPDAFPVNAYALKNLDRRRVPAPTVTNDAGLLVEKVTLPDPVEIPSGRTRIGGKLKSYKLSPSPRTRLQYTNIAMVGALEVTGAYGPPWLKFENNTCGVLPPGGSCTVDVRYLPEIAVPVTAARVWMEFRLQSDPPKYPLTGERFEASVTFIGEQGSVPVEEAPIEAPDDEQETGVPNPGDTPPASLEEILAEAGCQVPPGILKKVRDTAPVEAILEACATGEWGSLLQAYGE